MLLILVAIMLLADAFMEPVGPQGEWPHILRLALSTVALFGVTAFYIRWNDWWARKHADEEFRLRGLELDVDRASWVVETAFEWKDSKYAQLPADLLERLTTNLFAEGVPAERAKLPAEDLASALLRASAGIRVSLPGGGEISLDRAGVRRFQAALNASDEK